MSTSPADAAQDDARQWPLEIFNPSCTRCPRLAEHLRQMRLKYPDYYNLPVGPFGVRPAQLLIVGLAPGAHGANASGRPFTGDYAGILLYQTLFKLGLATRPESTARDDGLRLRNCRISNAVKCLPPANKPTTDEVDTCNSYLLNELHDMPHDAVIVALGLIAHRAVLRAFELRLSGYPFAHGRVHALPNGRRLVDSYHCSRYNTQTRRLTPEMFEAALSVAKSLAFT